MFCSEEVTSTDFENSNKIAAELTTILSKSGISDGPTGAFQGFLPLGAYIPFSIFGSAVAFKTEIQMLDIQPAVTGLSRCQ